MAELDILLRCRAARAGEKSVDGLVVERDEQAERDAKLGAMVRQLPEWWELYHGYAEQHADWWVVYDVRADETASGADTPEVALAAVLKEAKP